MGITYVTQNLEGLPFVIGSLRGETEARTSLIGAIEEARRSAHVQAAITGLFYLTLFDTAIGDARRPGAGYRMIAEFRGPETPRKQLRLQRQPRSVFDRVLAVEYCFALGESEQADRYLDQLSRSRSTPDSGGSRRHGPVARAGRGLARETSSAIESFEKRLEAHHPSENPFELARTELLYGATLRRAKRRGEAREMISRRARSASSRWEPGSGPRGPAASSSAPAAAAERRATSSLRPSGRSPSSARPGSPTGRSPRASS